MKTFKTTAHIICLFCIFFTTSCEKERVADTTEPTDSSSNLMLGTWVRNDGQLTTFVKISETTAITCNNGTATNGTFNSSQLSMTYVVGGVTYVFPMRMQGDVLIVMVPTQGTANHVDTPYIRSTTWPCGGTGGGTGGGTSTGNGMFWIASDLQVGNISVTCNGSTQIISSYYSSGAPSCGATGCANFTLNPGTNSYHASAGSTTWDGTINITSSGCTRQQLIGSGGGSGGGGGGGGGGSTTGNLTVWTQSDHSCGNITVNVSGQSGTISSYYSGGTVNCGDSGCANFSLAPGNYAISASCQSYTWSGTATVTAGGCFTLRLQ